MNRRGLLLGALFAPFAPRVAKAAPKRATGGLILNKNGSIAGFRIGEVPSEFVFDASKVRIVDTETLADHIQAIDIKVAR